eukprot:7175460-Prymnesium_polylepis.1
MSIVDRKSFAIASRSESSMTHITCDDVGGYATKLSEACHGPPIPVAANSELPQAQQQPSLLTRSRRKSGFHSAFWTFRSVGFRLQMTDAGRETTTLILAKPRQDAAPAGFPYSMRIPIWLVRGGGAPRAAAGPGLVR